MYKWDARYAGPFFCIGFHIHARGTLASLLLASGGSLPICLYISQSEYFRLSSRYSGHLSKVAWLPHPLAILIPFLAGSWIFSHAD